MTAAELVTDLKGQELSTWRSYLVATRLLFDELDRCLHEDAGMSLPDYGLLARLAEAGDDGLRMSELADSTVFSRSRISHAVSRLERDGWVERRSCPTDRRGSYAALTEAGHARLAAARPIHAEVIRRHLFANLTRAQTETLGTAMDLVKGSLGGGDAHC